MGANRRVLCVVAGAAAIVLGTAGAGYGVYDAWQQEQIETSMSDPHGADTDAGGSSTLRSSPANGDRTTTPTPEPTRTKADNDRSEQSSPQDSPSRTPKQEKTERAGSPDESSPDPTPSRDKSADESSPKPSPDETAASSEESRFASEVVRLTNVERQKAGCDDLRIDPALSKAARKHSADMSERDYFDHNSPDGATPWKRMLAAGYEQPAAENIAKGQSDAASVVDAWMDSDGHRQNILNCSYEAIGVGVELDDGPYWTQNFGFE